MDTTAQAALLRIQNMMMLCKQLKLPVQFKVSRIHRQEAPSPAAAAAAAAAVAAADAADHDMEQPANEATQELAVIVHVLSDYAFKKYLQHCSASDLMLLRGLLLKVETNAAMDRILSARVQQAFLPKFENEGQDSSIADAIVQHADERPMVVTIKHSGSLVTLSSQGFAAKNSLDNEYSAGAAVLLQAHFVRLLGCEAAAQQRLAALMDALQQRQLAISFEMVTGCHGHHGQLPAGEYLVATSAHTAGSSGQPEFLSWLSFLQLCLQFGLPLNDTWILPGTAAAAAAAARELLDHLALSGCPTGEALQQLTVLVEEPDTAAAAAAAGDAVDAAAAAAAARKGVHLPGTYPHEQWQGSRIEGFVVSQGQPVAGQQGWQQLLQLGQAMQRQVVRLEQCGGQQQLQRPYQWLLEQAGQWVCTYMGF
ncbi:hypothetical protein OEZ85_009328 [Tetradesmus obliquus]|uniref:Uncharacterized protein n=1 Tax=Tetradesmus obliquus TaxID=3088 RepID=A0ABY8UBS7_TETOB|nr:hypothetical protein OEZ85_009328 [Tetradesmus obliquus]